MKRLMWKEQWKRFLQSSSGSAMPMIGLASFVLIGSAGVAIDMGRIQIVQSRMSNALDAAGLAAGATINTVNATTEATKYFYANFPSGYMGSTVNSLSVTSNADGSLLILDVSGTVPLTFMKLFGKTTAPVAAHAEITRASRGMELVLVLDTTGSMADSAGGGISKMTAAKNASKQMLDILYGTNNTVEDLWVGLVPFAQAVNIGSSRGSWTSNPTMPSPGWGPTSWMGCVDAREASNRDTTDDPPSVALFPKYYWACHDSYNDWYGNNSAKDDCDTTGGGFGYHTPINTDRGPNKYCSQAITPLTASKTTVVNAINSLSPDGNTHVVLGAAWAYRLLSPRWQTLWGGEMNTNNLPLAYNTNLMNKVVVLMTDGDNTISNSVRGAYGYLSNGKLGTTNQSTAENQLDARTLTVCTNMKNNGIILYTIAFGTSISTSAQNMLKSCATKPEYYFYSPTSSSLSSAFHMIGDSLANLRISK